jgi:hypothetical protein
MVLYNKPSFQKEFKGSLAASYSHKGQTLTTIGAEELNFRVRDGNGCDLFAIATKQPFLFSFLLSNDIGMSFFQN